MIVSFRRGPFSHRHGPGPGRSDILPRQDQVCGSPLSSALPSLTQRKESYFWSLGRANPCASAGFGALEPVGY